MTKLVVLRDDDPAAVSYATTDGAEIAVTCLRRVHEMGRCSRRGEGGGDLSCDMARFAHAADDDPPLSGENYLHRAAEISVERLGESRIGRLVIAIEDLARDADAAIGDVACAFHGDPFGLGSPGVRVSQP